MKSMLLALLMGTGCTSYYYQSNLNRLSPGTAQQQFLQSFAGKHGLTTTVGATVRASKMVGPDRIDVVTLPLSQDGTRNPVEYWFVFKNATLVQWGRPEDWKAVAATYQVDFNPAPGVRPPGP